MVLAPNNWNGPWMNRQQLFSRMGKMHNVIYSTGPFYSWQIKSQTFINASFFSTTKISDNVIDFGASKLHTRVKKIPFLDWLAKKLFGLSIKKQTSSNKESILYLFHPQFSDMQDVIEHDILVYHAYDDFSKQGGYTDEVRLNEKSLVLKSNIVFASSRSIKNRLETLSGRGDIIFLPNGVDYTLFSNENISECSDLKDIPHPRIGYVGSINKKIDLKLLAFLSESLPHYSFVIVGQVGLILDEDKGLLDELIGNRNNVYFLGNKKPSEIASYMHSFDVNTMIYKSDNSTWASSGYPLKLHEYLATGKPVVSANIEAVREFSDVVTLAKTREEWLQAVIDSSADKDLSLIELRRGVASNNTWDSRVEQIEQAINKNIEGLSV